MKQIQIQVLNFLTNLNNRFNKIPSMTPQGFLNGVFIFCIMSFVTSCTSNAEGYSSAEQVVDTIRTQSIPYDDHVASTIGTSLQNREITADGADTSASKYKIKSPAALATETISNTEQALIDAKKRVEELEILEKSKSSTIVNIPLDSTGTTPKPKSPATTKIYNCPCLDIHKIQPKTTPSGVVAYYKNKYPKLDINELARINKPGIITTPSKFKAGVGICLKRKSCNN